MFPENTKILIVDDMKVMRSLVKKALYANGLKDIQQATNGAEAWEIVQKEEPKFQLIVSDWNMPEMTGLDFLKKVRADERFKNTPFVLLTAEGEKGQIVEAVQAGVDNYILKPFTADSLKEKLSIVYKKYNT